MRESGSRPTFPVAMVISPGNLGRDHCRVFILFDFFWLAWRNFTKVAKKCVLSAISLIAKSHKFLFFAQLVVSAFLKMESGSRSTFPVAMAIRPAHLGRDRTFDSACHCSTSSSGPSARSAG